MMKDKNSEKRYEYDLQIMDKERAIEESHQGQRQAERSIEDFSTQMSQTFRELQAIEEEQNEGQTSFSETEQKRKYIENLLVQQQEEVTSQYRKAHNLMEDEREQLQKERTSLSSTKTSARRTPPVLAFGRWQTPSKRKVWKCWG